MNAKRDASTGGDAHRLYSGAFSGRERVEEFRETYGRAVMQLDISPYPDHPLDIDFIVRGFPGFGLARGRISPTHNTHSSSMVRDDDPVLIFTPQGSGTLRQFGREVTISDGQATLISNGAPGVFLGNVPSKLCIFRLDRTLLASRVVDADAAMAQLIPRTNPALRLMASYANIVDDAGALATTELRNMVAGHMHDLAAMMLSATRDGLHFGRTGGVRAARLHAIRQDIAANLSRPDLSLETLAQRHGMSARAIRDLFRQAHTTFTDYVLAQRLISARRMLCDPRHAGRSISTIAYDAGFGDLSYFNRAFRQRFGATPSEIRSRG